MSPMLTTETDTFVARIIVKIGVEKREREGERSTLLFPRFSIVRRMHRISVDLSSRSNSLSIIKNCQTHFGRIDASLPARAESAAPSSPRVIGSKPREKGERRGVFRGRGESRQEEASRLYMTARSLATTVLLFSGY